MKPEEAKEYIPNFDSFRKEACDCCSNDWYCPSDCETLKKAKIMDFESIQKAYARHDGEMDKVFAYIKSARG